MEKRSLIGGSVVLGVGVNIMSGESICNNISGGANTLVVNSSPDNSVVGDVPANNTKQIKCENSSCEDGEISSEIFILMGTYNGSRYIEKQIESIQAQDYKNWRLVIRDDSSTDNTLQIVESIALEDERVHLLSDEEGNVGAAANFGFLLEYAKENSALYVALADQDDFWQKWKLKRQLLVMLEAENINKEEPVLVYSDLMVVDDSLRYLSPSLMSYQLMRHESVNPLEVLLVQNYVTGCTVFFNKSLLSISVPLPPSALMHDWWLAMLAGACGKLCYIDEPLVYYRQHGGNVVGATNFLGLLNPRKTSWQKIWKFWEEGNKRFPQSVVQAQDLYKRIDERNLSISPETKEFISNYLGVWSRKGLPWIKVYKILQLGIRRQNFFIHILFVIRCLLGVYSKSFNDLITGATRNDSD